MWDAGTVDFRGGRGSKLGVVALAPWMPGSARDNSERPLTKTHLKL
jgi:hypothetical protein